MPHTIDSISNAHTFRESEKSWYDCHDDDDRSAVHYLKTMISKTHREKERESLSFQRAFDQGGRADKEKENSDDSAAVHRVDAGRGSIVERGEAVLGMRTLCCPVHHPSTCGGGGGDEDESDGDKFERKIH